ncbi:MAG: S9 family peptidase [Bacteroidales bacterium]|nr:S9 family peptidase [Bacteroidales bacterium]
MKNAPKLVLMPFILLLLSQLVFAEHGQITLEKIWTDRYFTPKTITRGLSMADGLHYTLIHERYNINKHRYETGELVDSIFSTRGLLEDEAGNPLAIDTYSFSPDETMLLIGVNLESIYRRSRRAEYYIWNRTDGSLAPLSEGTKQRLPDFSPDGTKIAFVRQNNLYIKDLETFEEYAVTTDGRHNHIINGTTDWVYEEEFYLTKGFEWSPDGRRIAYLRFDESHVKEFVMMKYGQLYPEEYRFKYPKAGEENAHVSLHVFDLDTKTVTTVDTGGETDQYLPRIGWTQDAGVLSVQRLNRHQNFLEILLADAVTGETTVLYEERNPWYIKVSFDLRFLNDGRHFIISSEKNGFNQLYLFNMEGHMVRLLTPGEYDVESFLGVDEDHGLVYYLARPDSPVSNELYVVGLDGSGRKRLSSGTGTNSPTFSKGFTYYINRFSTASSPPVYSIHTSDGALIEVLQDNHELVEKVAEHAFVKPEFFTFYTSEDVLLHGLMIKPPDFDPELEYPVLMFVYGGPDSQTVTESWNTFNGVWFQMLAQQGFIVVTVDNRGAGGRGEYFRKMTYLQLGKYETIDQIEAAKYLGAKDYIDARRIAIFGWSYGGYVSSLCLAKGADYFAAAIAVAPVTSWRFYDTIYTERYMRTPQENPDGYDDNSPINHVDKIRGAYLLVHGSADDNVHYQNTIEMADALIKAGVDFELMIYPDHNHSIFTSHARLHLYRLMTDFLHRSIMQ